MEKIRLNILIVVCICMGGLVFISSCDFLTTSEDEFLERFPLDQPSPEVFFVDESSAQQAVAAAYWPLVRGSFAMYRRDLSILFDAMSDDAHWRPAIANAISQANWDFNASSQYFDVYWNNLYRSINAANYAIVEIPTLLDRGMTQEQINPYIAEAHFIRGFAYLFLANFYGDVPLITTPLRSFEEFEQPKIDQEIIFDQAISDFVFARDHLPESWPSALAGSATKAAAAAYLAKAYLYKQDYSNAESAAREAVQIAEASDHYLIDDYEAIFDIDNEGNPELLFYFMFVDNEETQGTNATINRLTRMNPPEFDHVYGAPGRGYMLPQRDLYDAFEDDDPRRGYSIFAPGDDFGIYQRDQPFTYSHQTYNEDGELISYERTYTVGDTIEYDMRWSETGMNTRKKIYNISHLGFVTWGGMDSPQMRMAELYLILAEALAEQGNPEALDWVNEVRARPSVNLPPKQVGDMGLDLVGLVRHERRVELNSEGHRLWDLIRWRKVKEVFGDGTKVKRHFFSDYIDPSDVSTRFDNPSLGNYPDDHILFPIPQDEIDQNSLINTNNPGY